MSDDDNEGQDETEQTTKPQSETPPLKPMNEPHQMDDRPTHTKPFSPRSSDTPDSKPNSNGAR